VWDNWPCFQYLQDHHDNRQGRSWYQAGGHGKSRNFVSKATRFADTITSAADKYQDGSKVDRMRRAIRHFEQERGGVALGRYVESVLTKRKSTEPAEPANATARRRVSSEDGQSCSVAQ